MTDEGILRALRADEVVAAGQHLPYAGANQPASMPVSIRTRKLGWVRIIFELRVSKREGNDLWHWHAVRADLSPPDGAADTGRAAD